MPTLVERLSGKIGPLPTWAWAAIPAGGYVIWSYIKAAQEPVIVDETGAPLDETDTSDYGLNTGGMYLPGYGAAPNGSSNLPPIDTPDPDNETWFRQASNFLISEGVNATDVITALNAYIYGVPASINTTQMNALQRALIRFGAAPDGGFIPRTTPAPTTPPPSSTVTKPEAPTNVGVAASTKTSITFVWSPPQRNGGAAIIGYQADLWRNLKGKQQRARASLLLPTVRRKTEGGLGKASWQLRVRARNSKGWGPYANSRWVVL